MTHCELLLRFLGGVLAVVSPLPGRRVLRGASLPRRGLAPTVVARTRQAGDG